MVSAWFLSGTAYVTEDRRALASRLGGWASERREFSRGWGSISSGTPPAPPWPRARRDRHARPPPDLKKLHKNFPNLPNPKNKIYFTPLTSFCIGSNMAPEIAPTLVTACEDCRTILVYGSEYYVGDLRLCLTQPDKLCKTCAEKGIKRELQVHIMPREAVADFKQYMEALWQEVDANLEIARLKLEAQVAEAEAEESILRQAVHEFTDTIDPSIYDQSPVSMRADLNMGKAHPREAFENALVNLLRYLKDA